MRVESNVPNLAIDIGATLELMINDNKDLYAFIECHLFVDGLIGPNHFETYGTRTLGITFCGHRFSHKFMRDKHWTRYIRGRLPDEEQFDP